MLRLYTNWFDKKRRKIFRELGKVAGKGVLGGGTAIALQLKHRKSYDFDVFYNEEIEPKLFREISEFYGSARLELLRDSPDELSVLVDGIKLTFLCYPFPPLHRAVPNTTSISLFDLKDLASDKAYAMGRRPVYRDYVDLYFLLKSGTIDLDALIEEASKRFKGAFSEKLFLEQLIYLEDLKDFSVEFLGESVEPDEVKGYFEEVIGKYLAGKNDRG